MKILIIANNFKEKDGWSRYSSLYKKALETEGNKVVSVSEEGGDGDFSFLKEPSKYIRNIFLSYVHGKKLEQVIKKEDPDVIHFFVEPYANLLSFIKKNKKKLYCITLHGTYAYFPHLHQRNLFSRFLSGFIYKKALKKIDQIIAVSSYTKDFFLKKYKEDPRREIVVLNNAINIENSSFMKNKNIGEEKVLITVGEVKSRKGSLQVIDALKGYSQKYGKDNFLYYIIGKKDDSSDYVQLLKKKIKEYGFEKKIFLTGKVAEEELKNYYSKADLFIMTSINDGFYFEGFGLVYLEANVRGVPVIGSNDSGTKDAIKDGFSGFAVNPTSSEEISEAIYKVLDERLIKKENCLAWAKNFDISTKAKKLINLYESLLSNKL